jgi:hypothetical protein
MGTPEKPHTPGVKSNVRAFVLAPQVGPMHVAGGELQVTVDPPVAAGRRATLLLNELGAADPRAYSFRAVGDGTNPLVVPIPGAGGGEYLVRVQVDGAVSPLAVTGDAYGEPRVTL